MRNFPWWQFLNNELGYTLVTNCKEVSLLKHVNWGGGVLIGKPTYQYKHVLVETLYGFVFIIFTVNIHLHLQEHYI